MQLDMWMTGPVQREIGPVQWLRHWLWRGVDSFFEEGDLGLWAMAGSRMGAVAGRHGRRGECVDSEGRFKPADQLNLSVINLVILDDRNRDGSLL